MPLHQRVGEIFLANESDEERAAFSISLKRFLVPDRGTDREGLEVVLLVESPHTNEVRPREICNRYPLAGSTGKYILQKFVEWELELPDGPEHPDSIGELVHQGHETVQKLGIMNVSQLPFQRKAYACNCNHYIPQRENDCRDNANWNDYTYCMEYIKKCPGVKSYMRTDDEQTQRLQELRCKIDQLEYAIIEDLAGRLEPIGENVQVMCLGEVAQTFYLKSFYYRNTNRHILGFLHSSRQWDINRRYWDNLHPRNDQRLQGILDRLRPPQPRT